MRAHNTQCKIKFPRFTFKCLLYLRTYNTYRPPQSLLNEVDKRQDVRHFILASAISIATSIFPLHDEEKVYYMGEALYS